MKINIAGGSGLMGRIHKPVLEKAGHEVITSGRTSPISLEEAAKISDLTIVSVPIHATEEVIERVAPYCSCLMDFTSLKVFPIKAMLNYSKVTCEVGGLHPDYGEVSSIKGRTIIYCPTERSNKKCDEIVSSFEQAGAIIKRMSPETHDFLVGGVIQYARVKLLKTFALLVKNSGRTIQEIYDISPPPTRILLDLLARQSDEEKDDLYEEMREFNPLTQKITQGLLDAFKRADDKDAPRRIRELYGDRLKESQESARGLIED